MTPRKALAAVSLAAIAFALAALVAVVVPTPAHGQDAPAITPGTACGAPGVGRLVGVANPVARSASEAAGSYVAEDGYWHTPCPLVATPGTACGAPGVGRMDGAGMLRREAPGWRVDADGAWVRCDRQCLAESTGQRKTWSASGLTCSSPSPDRAIDHGRAAVWLATGATRGTLIEQCVDGARSVSGATCEAATTCGAGIRATRDGVLYLPPAGQRAVPNGAGIELRSASGATWPARCVAGQWDVPAALPRARPDAPARPAVAAGCRPGVWSAGGRYYRYDQPATDGQTVTALGLMGAAPAEFVCAGGRFIVPPKPSVPPASSSKSGAAEWQRKFEQLQREGK